MHCGIFIYPMVLTHNCGYGGVHGCGVDGCRCGMPPDHPWCHPCYTLRATNDSKSGTAIMWWLLADKWSDLMPMKGGFGASRMGMQTIKGCNRGKVREAGCHIREFCGRRIISCMPYVIKCN